MVDETEQFTRPRVVAGRDDEPEAPEGPGQTIAGTDPLETQAAHLFADRMADQFKYNNTMGEWFVWTGMRWQVDDRQRAKFEMLQMVERMRRADAQNRRPLGKASFTNAALSLSQTMPDISRTAEDFDANHMLVGTPTGFLDLETGEHHRPDPNLMISKCLGVAPSDEADCPIWLQFLEEATANHEGLMDYLQVFFGYSLTGSMKEEIMTFVYGPGGNGKGVMLKTIGSIFGDFYTSTPASTFMETNRNEHPTELADLQGRRLVSASETDEDAKWNLSRIKEITGNENPIKARYMRQNFFEFWPVCKLMIIGNNMPEIGNVDPAIARRLRLIEMTNLPKRVDNDLKEKLMPERPAILRWMLKGLETYQKEGLIAPDCVTKASSAYLAAEDVVGQFLQDCCEPWNGGILLRKDIGFALQLYMKDNGIRKKVAQTKVYKRLVEPPYDLIEGDTYRKARCYKGIRLNDYGWSLILRQIKRDGGDMPEMDGLTGVKEESYYNDLGKFE